MSLNIQETFSGKSVFITGASGFLGKAVAERILCECENINKIFLLFRGKRGYDYEKRFQKFLDSSVFVKVKETNPDLMKKFVSIQGDLMVSPSAGIAEEDLKVLEANVNFVFHCAASINLDETLKKAVITNTIGTRNMLDMSEKFHNLEGFVHISTAFSNCNIQTIDEIVYDPVLDYNKVISACEANDEEELKKMEKIVLNTYPNTYIFSKNITEKLVSERNNIPAAILRPSYVSPAVQEPKPGWCEFSMTGPIGVFFAGSLGILRCFPARPSVSIHMVPVDFCANSIIAAGAFVKNQSVNEVKVFNCACSEASSVTWGEFLSYGDEVCDMHPSPNAVWVPNIKTYDFYPFFWMHFVFLQILPSYFVDLLLVIFGKKPMLASVQKRMFSGLTVTSPFMRFQWIWKNENLVNLFEMMTKADQ